MDTHRRYDVVVIGAGQAGLAVGYHLAQRGLDFLIVDANEEIGRSWRTRWDSLRLFTPAEYDGLPGTPFPAPDGTHPTKDQVADYLQDYAVRHGLPVRLGTRVVRLSRERGSFRLETTTGRLAARHVVIATGPFQVPHVPSMASQLPSDIVQLHSAHYRNPDQLPRGRRVLVVGAANSGLQIAHELAGRRTVSLAVGSTPTQLPQRLLGRDLFHWLTRFGVLTQPADSPLARRLRRRGDLVIGSSTRALRRRGVDVRPRLTGFQGREALFSDSSRAPIGAVVWATGYRSDYSWLDLPNAVADGKLVLRGSGTAVPRLHVVGLPWLTSRASALLGFVGRDAEQVAERIAQDPAPARLIAVSAHH
jgi:putative flavoprotein involved in K+ transport